MAKRNTMIKKKCGPKLRHVCVQDKRGTSLFFTSLPSLPPFLRSFVSSPYPLRMRAVFPPKSLRPLHPPSRQIDTASSNNTLQSQCCNEESLIRLRELNKQSATMPIPTAKLCSFHPVDDLAHSFHIDDLPVYFPYERIYPEQYAYMCSLKQALDAQVSLSFAFEL